MVKATVDGVLVGSRRPAFAAAAVGTSRNASQGIPGIGRELCRTAFAEARNRIERIRLRSRPATGPSDSEPRLRSEAAQDGMRIKGVSADPALSSRFEATGPFRTTRRLPVRGVYSFLKSTILGGLFVLLPVAVLAAIVGWAVNLAIKAASCRC